MYIGPLLERAYCTVSFIAHVLCCVIYHSGIFQGSDFTELYPKIIGSLLHHHIQKVPYGSVPYRIFYISQKESIGLFCYQLILTVSHLYIVYNTGTVRYRYLYGASLYRTVRYGAVFLIYIMMQYVDYYILVVHYSESMHRFELMHQRCINDASISTTAP